MDRQGIFFIIITVFVVLLFFISIVLFTCPDISSVTSEPESVSGSLSSSESDVSSISDDLSNYKPISSLEPISNLLEKAGISEMEFQNTGSKQLVVVESTGNAAHISFFELKKDKWININNLSCSGFVGENGTTNKMHEGNNASPKGLYSIGDAFYIFNKPETTLNSFQITENTYWVDDPDSSFYNKRVEGVENKDWQSAEHMIDYTKAYEYGFVINYNEDAVYNAGSAIFFHISDGPTAGCIGTSKEKTLAYLAALDITKNPYILII